VLSCTIVLIELNERIEEYFSIRNPLYRAAFFW